MAKSFPNTGATVGLAADRTAMTSMLEGQEFFETDTNKMFVYSGSGWVQTNSWSTTSGVTGVNSLIVPPAAIIRRVATQSFSNGVPALMSFDTEDADTDSMWSSGTTITIQTTGIYTISAFVNFSTASGPGLREVAIKKNGVSSPGAGGPGGQTSMPNSSYSHNVTASGISAMVATDTITLEVFQNCGSAMNVTGTISVIWVGRTS